MLRRRGIVMGMKLAPGAKHKTINDAWEYRNTSEISFGRTFSSFLIS